MAGNPIIYESMQYILQRKITSVKMVVIYAVHVSQASLITSSFMSAKLNDENARLKSLFI